MPPRPAAPPVGPRPPAFARPPLEVPPVSVGGGTSPSPPSVEPPLAFSRSSGRRLNSCSPQFNARKDAIKAVIPALRSWRTAFMALNASIATYQFRLPGGPAAGYHGDTTTRDPTRNRNRTAPAAPRRGGQRGTSPGPHG